MSHEPGSKLSWLLRLDSTNNLRVSRTSNLLLIRLFQQNAIGCGLGFGSRAGKVRTAAYSHVRRGVTPRPESQQGLERSHESPTSIMTEDELVQINLELIPTHAVISSDQPLLKVSNGSVRQRYHRFGTPLQVCAQWLDAGHMPESDAFQPGEALEAIRVDNRARCHVLLQKSEEGFAPEIRHDSYSGTSAPAPSFLHCYKHQSGFATLELPTSSQSGLGSPDPGIIHFHFATQRFAFPVDHRPTQFVEHHPCSLITRESELVLQQKRRDATFIGGHQVSRPKPNRQWDFR